METLPKTLAADATRETVVLPDLGEFQLKEKLKAGCHRLS